MASMCNINIRILSANGSAHGMKAALQMAENEMKKASIE
jgi:hypothetical protein